MDTLFHVYTIIGDCESVELDNHHLVDSLPNVIVVVVLIHGLAEDVDMVGNIGDAVECQQVDHGNGPAVLTNEAHDIASNADD